MMKAVYRKIRVKKEEAAFLYALLESYEGITGYTTMDHQEGMLFREVELMIAPDFQEDLARLLDELKGMVWEVKS